MTTPTLRRAICVDGAHGTEVHLPEAPLLMTPAQAARYIWPDGKQPKDRKWLDRLERDGTAVRGFGRRIYLRCRVCPGGRVVYRQDLERSAEHAAGPRGDARGRLVRARATEPGWG